jgi:hypothetical protein
VLPTFPFGTDFTGDEQKLLPALKVLKAASPLQLAVLALRGLSLGGESDCLERMGLAKPASMKELIYAALLRAALRESRR